MPVSCCGTETKILLSQVPRQTPLTPRTASSVLATALFSDILQEIAFPTQPKAKPVHRRRGLLRSRGTRNELTNGAAATVQHGTRRKVGRPQKPAHKRMLWICL
ncbi:MAG: hypothetical protein BJ554DRAFT_7699 [Olpidium bornovanus]|uniref:Uncharacterized protein n=1 Tax=Olpidium bornovanus TaxID=278681 RepID=A0A8H7ZVH4_9FUNG|nr:MAG: hypothetical protein BJ554DRAFT_7699 [Olpidium bornovanus]